MPRPAACLLPVLSPLLLLPAVADAQSARRAVPPDPLFDHRVSVTLAAGFAPLSTSVRLDGADGTPGTLLSGEDDLALAGDGVALGFDLTLRPRPRHRVRLGLEPLPGNRRARVALEEDIRFGDEVYLAGETVQSSLRLRAWSASYLYSILRIPSAEVALSFGLASLDLRAEAGVPARGVREREETWVPAPQLGAEATLRFSRRWYGELRYRYFDADLDDNRGTLYRIDLGVMYQLNPQLAVGLAVTRFDVEAERVESGDTGLFRQRTDSVMLAIRAGL